MGARALVAGLGLAQTIAWASTYYLPAVLARPIAADLGCGEPVVHAGLSIALLVAAAVGPWAGGLIDRHGGNRVLAAASLVFALGLAWAACAASPAGLLAAWAMLGLAMGSGLYEGAFGAVVALDPAAARRRITGIALIAGFASTVGWPASVAMEAAWGWRGACLGWAVLHLAVALPVHLAIPRGSALPPAAAAADDDPRRGRIAVLLAAAFAVTWFTSTAMAAHLPALLGLAGLEPGAALFCAMLVGPAQVAARIAEFTLLARLHPLLPARLAGLAHPLGACAVLASGAAAPLFAIMHGAGNGVLTIAKGTLPLALLGPAGYGARQGWIMAPARLGQAAAPMALALAMQAWGLGALWLTIGLGAAGAVALFALPGPVALRPPAPAGRPAADRG